MTKKSKLIRALSLVIAVITVVVTVSAVNGGQVNQATAEVTEATPTNTVTTYFHEVTGTLIVSGTGALEGYYPLDLDREWPWEVPATYDNTIKHIVVSEGITAINNSFNGLLGLESISLPEGITCVDDSFMECSALVSVDFPESLEEILGFAFADCSSLKHVDFKSTLNIDGGYCGAPFNNCKSLKEVTIPGGSTLYSAFVGCSALENVYVGREGLTIYEVNYSDDIEEIAMPSFRGCNSNLKLHYVEGSLKCPSDAVYWDRVYIENMPDKVALTVTEQGINVNWNGRTGAEVYHVYRKAKGDKSWTKLADTKLTYYDDLTVKSGVEYSYCIKVDKDTDKLTSDYTRFVGTPVIKSTTQTTTGIKISWGKVDGATKYRVYRRAHNASSWTKVADVTGTSYNDNKVSSGVRYHYTVRAFGKTGYGDYDRDYPYTIFLKSPKVTAKKVSGGVQVNWECVGCQGYYLYRKTAGGSWQRIHSVYSSNSTSFLDTTAKKGVQYSYTVRSFTFDSNECQRSEYKAGVNFKY